MKLERGDLIAIKTIDDTTITGIVTHVFFNKKYIYCYLIDYDHSQVIYEKEIKFVIGKGYELDISWEDEFFNLDYYLYEMYTNKFYTGYDYDSEDDTED